MKKLLGLIILAACGTPDDNYTVTNNPIAGKDGKSCTVTDNALGALVTCDDGTSQLISDGSKGDQGAKGDTGTQGSKGEKGNTGMTGATGSKGDQGVKGDTGAKGATGANGAPGTTTEATSCTVAMVKPSDSVPNGGALITCGKTHALILNGYNGKDGKDGHDGKDHDDGHNHDDCNERDRH